MPPEPSTERTFTEKEAYALVADNVQRETAEAKAANEQLEREKAELQSKLDIAEAAVATEKAARETAEKALEDYKASIETEKAQEARKGERVGKVREVAKHLTDDWFTDERAARWASMDDEAFDAYVRELAELVPAGGQSTENAPRETAMTGEPITANTKGGAFAAFLSGPKSKEG